jgi:hypothetical protein
MPSGAETALLQGAAMGPFVSAIGEMADAGIARFAVVGGVAVSARLGQAHRATVDVDTVVDEDVPPDAIEALLRLPGAVADPSRRHRVFLHGTQVEVIGVGSLAEEDLEGIPDRAAFFVAAHSWALDTATPLTLVAPDAGSVRATAPVAVPAALVAMKLNAIEDRGGRGAIDKRGGDAWDIYRLLIDRDADGDIRRALGGASTILRRLVAGAADRVLVTGAARTRGWLAAGDAAMGSVTADELRFLGERLLAGLQS